MTVYFPFQEYFWLYGAFTLFVILLLVIDLGLFHRTPREISFKEASLWSVIWISLGLLFGFGLFWYCKAIFPNQAYRLTLEYLTGFVIEKSLAIDNIFVFVIIFRYFAIPPKYQYRVLFFGIIGALLFRILFITGGALVIAYKPAIYLFGLFLILTGIKCIFTTNSALQLENNFLIRFLQKHLPVSSCINGPEFFCKINSKWRVTPLFSSHLHRSV